MKINNLQVNDEINNLNTSLNEKISQSEIIYCIKKLSNDKVRGDDLIRNKFIKSTTDMFVSLYANFFNLIFDSGLIPDTWLTGNIPPFYKNKGSPMDPKKL